MKPTAEDIIEKAREFLYIREAQSVGQNRGLRVEAIQKWGGGQPGDSWCVEFVWMVLDMAYKGLPPMARLQNCESVRGLAVARGWLRKTPAIGDLVLHLNKEGLAHHIGIVTGLAPLTSIAGNTSADGTSANGDRVAEHAITPEGKLFVHYASLQPGNVRSAGPQGIDHDQHDDEDDNANDDLADSGVHGDAGDEPSDKSNDRDEKK